MILMAFMAVPVFSQTIIKGKVIDTHTGEGLAYVNIGIENQDVGTVSDIDGYFSISLLPAQGDSLTFSMVGYDKATIPVKQIRKEEWVIVKLASKAFRLHEVSIVEARLIEKKYGIKRRGIVHFTDGIFKKNDSFEIGQVVRMGSRAAQITSVNLYISSARRDSATFRINFYAFDQDENAPSHRIVEHPILQRHPIQPGWLKFDLADLEVKVSGDVLIAIEFIPENKDVSQIFYEVKLGGFSKSFYRTASLGRWNSPPHHYCLYATALVEKTAPDDTSDLEPAPTHVLPSTFTKTRYHIFVRLPKDYNEDAHKSYPVVYHLDGNVYHHSISAAVNKLSRRKEIPFEPIVIGIGYENAYVMDSLRTRDYTFLASRKDSIPISGGGDLFYNFIRLELMPHIDSIYRTDISNRTIMGHSLGGYFALYAMSRDDKELLFNNFIAASPSIYYQEDFVTRFQKDLKESRSSGKVFISIGELELDKNSRRDFEQLSTVLSKYGQNKVKFKEYKNLEHLGTANPSFQDGIKFIMN